MNNKDFTNTIFNDGQGNTILMYEDGSAYHLEGKYKGEYTEKYYIKEDCYVDREYMRNTKIRVESEEHWNFVQKLLFNMDIVWWSSGKEIQEYNSDTFLQVDEYLNLTWRDNYGYDLYDDKEVILPMKGVVATEEIVTEKREERKAEWPQVGDEVYVTDKVMVNNSMQESAALIKDTYCKVVTKFVDQGYTFCVLKNDGSAYVCLLLAACIGDGTIVKSRPLTPEEELAKKILKFLEDGKTYDQLSKAIINGEISGLSYRKEG